MERNTRAIVISMRTGKDGRCFIPVVRNAEGTATRTKSMERSTIISPILPIPNFSLYFFKLPVAMKNRTKEAMARIADRMSMSPLIAM